MYADYYLKFATKEDADLLLYTVHPAVTNEEGTLVSEEHTTPNYQNIDLIGTLYTPSTEEDSEEFIPLEGYHANVRIVIDSEDPTPLLPYMVHPQHPRRIWAGGMYPAAAQ